MKTNRKHIVVRLDTKDKPIESSEIECESLEHAQAIALQLLSTGARILILNPD
jgi:hypothetical protein